MKRSSRLHPRSITITGNYSNFGGGGIYTATTSSHPVVITGSTITGNTSDSGGGGIWSHSPLTITDSTISGNSSGSGAGIVSGRNQTGRESLIMIK